ncbi:DNA-binding transcription factor yap1 [Mortierella sp. GBA30]|nr:DNA-binding transcription factor yap1 [Mortierella sp. GBA30]
MSLQPQQPSAAFTVPLSDNEWSQMLQNNQEAQDLLSNALAHHHEHYRPEEESGKRVISHLHHKSDHYSDAKASSGSYNEAIQYSEGDNSSDEANTPGDGKPAPKKAGRKPLTTEPTNKRKAQNRAAQRAFRERKEKYVKSLEDRIKELEEMNPGKSDTKLAEENMNLKVLVQKLETENYFLKEQSFTFDFPISQPGLYNVAKAQRDAAAQSLPKSQGAEESTLLSPAQSASGQVKPQYTPTTSAQKALSASNAGTPWTPPSSGGDSVPNSPLNHDLPTPEQDSISQVSYSDNGVVPRFRHGTPEEIALFSSLLDGAGNTYSNVTIGQQNNLRTLSHSQSSVNGIGSISTPVSSVVTSTQQIHNNHMFGSNSNLTKSSHLINPMQATHLESPSPSSTLALFSDNSPSPTLEELVNTPLFETTKDGQVHFTPPVAPMSIPSLSYEQTQALFTDFRDPSDPRDFFSGFDETVETTFPDDPIGGLFNDQLLDYGSGPFAPVGVSVPNNETQAVQEVAGEVPSTTTPCAEAPKHALPPLGENEKAIPCPQVWEHIAKHPNFDDADIDDLCAELKAKAKCSGHGPVIALSDVDKLMSKLNQE